MTSRPTALRAPELLAFADKVRSGMALSSPDDPYEFADFFHGWISGSKLNDLGGLSTFPVRETCIGVTHHIDALIMAHGEHGIQILEHDYAYYRRLWPHKEWALIGGLLPGKPLLIACPFPGYGKVHPAWNDILGECEAKDIDIHLDCAWLSAARNISIDLGHPRIASLAISLSKGMCLDWNRIAVRYSRLADPTDPITIANAHDMINSMDMAVGMAYMQEFGPDHLWTKWGNAYESYCRSNRLRPTDCIHMALELGTNKPVGTQDLLTL